MKFNVRGVAARIFVQLTRGLEAQVPKQTMADITQLMSLASSSNQSAIAKMIRDEINQVGTAYPLILKMYFFTFIMVALTDQSWRGMHLLTSPWKSARSQYSILR